MTSKAKHEKPVIIESRGVAEPSSSNDTIAELPTPIPIRARHGAVAVHHQLIATG